MDFLDERKEQLNTLISQYQQLLFIEEQKLINTNDTKLRLSIENNLSQYKHKLTAYLHELQKIQQVSINPEDLYKQTLLVLEEDFQDNQRNWRIGNDDSFVAFLQGGVYSLESKAEKVLFHHISVEVDFERDFEIETQIRYIRGTFDNGFGICWGSRLHNNFFCFEISNSGSATCRKLDDNKIWRSLAPWTKFGFIYGEGIPNVLKVCRQGQTMIGYINQQKAFEWPAEPTQGQEVGIATQTALKLTIDYLKVKN